MINLELIQEENMTLIENYIGGKRRSNTKESYKSDLKVFSQEIKKSLLNVNIDDINYYFYTVLADYSPSSKNRKLSSIRDFYEDLLYRDMYNDEHNKPRRNPVGRMEVFKVDKKEEIKALTNEQAKQFFKEIKRNIKIAESDFQKKLHVRNLAMAHILINTGLRVEELTTLNFNELQLEDKYIVLTANKTKSQKSRYLDLGDTTIEYINNYLEIRDEFKPTEKDKKYIFLSGRGKKMSTNSVNEFLKKYAEAESCKIDNIHAHLFRDTFGTNYYKKNKDIKGLKNKLGHSSITTTEIYINIIDKAGDGTMTNLSTANY